MHVPDGLLGPYTCAATSAAAIALVGYAIYRAQRSPDNRSSLAALTAAGVFALQMLDFPIPGGASGHLLGGVLAGVLLGPWVGLLAMTCVLLVQCALFQDGGVTTLGANVLNMGVLGAAVGHGIYSIIRRRVSGSTGRLLGAVIASWCSVLLAAFFCSVEMAAGGEYGIATTLRAMLLPHAFIGAAEASITGIVLLAVMRLQPAAVEGSGLAGNRIRRPAVFAGLAAAVVLAVFASPLASALPDAFERAIEILGDAKTQALLPALFPDYTFPAADALSSAVSLAGGIGTLCVFVVGAVLARRWISPADR